MQACDRKSSLFRRRMLLLLFLIPVYFVHWILFLAYASPPSFGSATESRGTFSAYGNADFIPKRAKTLAVGCQALRCQHDSEFLGFLLMRKILLLTQGCMYVTDYRFPSTVREACEPEPYLGVFFAFERESIFRHRVCFLSGIIN